MKCDKDSFSNSEKNVIEIKGLKHESYIVNLTYSIAEDVLAWNSSTNEEVRGQVPMDYIIGVRLDDRNIVVKYYTVEYLNCCNSQYAIKQSNSVKIINLCFEILDPNETSNVDKFIETIDMSVSKVRPKKLLVIINPICGSGKAVKIYKDQVKPLFDFANLTWGVYETTEDHGGIEIGRSISLDYDGVVCISGDGMFSQLINGLLSRPDAEEARKLPLGLIPAGSQNALAVSVSKFHGIMWSLMCIITGKQCKLDVVKILNTEDNNVNYSISMISYGVLADIMSSSFEKRWMGPFRYQWCALKSFLGLRHYPIKIYFIPVKPESQRKNYSEVSEKDPEWQLISEDFVFMFCSFNISGANSQTPEQVKTDPDNGLLSLLVWRESTRKRVLEYIWKMSFSNHYDLDYVDFISAQAVKLEPAAEDKLAHINIDGEVFPISKFILTSLPRHVKLFMSKSETLTKQ